MSPSFDDASTQRRVSTVVIENPNSPDECVLYPADATDEELETTWVTAEEGDYVRPADRR
ncbi:DUF7511 domain-containing protein [Natrinema salsiterrestre]|uniref:DUF7511 domain-containing protein n=1 Tax=Natrinema salsiterrestre TaxID=2950540 RepID=A0A9Q4Q167_9EURY|nr:hypothetical protein [Natrinema salsiterrestre]MDF9747630.1 hypothetical protein [Natrinema salsiterrestre]